MTKITAHLPGLDEKSQLARQTDAANQRDSWLRQMELAQLSGMGKMDGVQPSSAKTSLTAPSASWSAILQPHATNPTENRSHVPAHTLAQTGHAVVQAGDQSAAPGSAQPRDSAVTRIHDAMQTSVEPNGEPGRAPIRAPIGDAATSAVMSARAGAAQALPAQRNSEAPAGQATPSRVQPLPVLPIAMTADSELQDAKVTDGEATQEETSTADSSLEEKSTWQKRMMHMTGEGEDVKLWIRDNELDATQSQDLVVRLASDIAGMGMRLKDATVNGKLAFRSDDDRDVQSAPGTRSRARRSAVTRDPILDSPLAIDSNNPTTEE